MSLSLINSFVHILSADSCDPFTEICPVVIPEPPPVKPPVPPAPEYNEWSGVFIFWMFGPFLQIISGGITIID